MAQHKSALKRHRQSVKRHARNQSVKSAVRTAVKKAREVEPGTPDTGNVIKMAQIALARAGTKGVFHKRTVARRISRLALMQNRLLAAPAPEQTAKPDKSKRSGKGKHSSKKK